MRAGDAAFHGRLRFVFHTRDPAGIQLLEKSLALFLREKFEKRGGQHIARGAHGAVDVENFHFFASIWLIMLARYPAPNPLSMLTTDTPLAQELSMERRADNPSKAAP